MSREYSDRRGVLRLLVGGVAAAAAVRTFPFRMYSFPPTPIVETLGMYVHYMNVSDIEWYDKQALEELKSSWLKCDLPPTRLVNLQSEVYDYGPA